MESSAEPYKPAAAKLTSALPAVPLPAKVPQQVYRPAQSNIPDRRALRDRLKRQATEFCAARNLVPPLSLVELKELASEMRESLDSEQNGSEEGGFDESYIDYVAVLINNAAWHDTLAQIPYERRLLLLPKCLRVEELCPAPFDEFGLLCKECGLCSIQDLTAEAERLGYAVLVAEGSAIVQQMITTGKIEAIVGVSCLNVLERSFPHMEASAVPGIAIPLLQDDCINCTVDLDWVWDVIHLTAEDKTYRLDLEALKAEVQGWFTPEILDQVMGPAEDITAQIAREWLARAGKRWRPYLTACVHLALGTETREQHAPTDPNLIKLAIAIECFHKASLIHDDIEDGDARRYGGPTLHVEHGTAVALNAGDFLLGEGYRLIAEVDAPAEIKVEMLRAAAEGHVTLSRGQGTELSWARNPEPLSSIEVLQIFRQKTAPAFDVALRLGALLAGAGTDVQDVLGTCSESLGIAYQIRDDLEDFDGSSDSHDLRDLRPSLLLAIAAKRTQDQSSRELIEALFRHSQDYAPVQGQVQRILRDSGAIEKAGALLEAYEEQAVRSLRFLKDATLKGLLRRVVGKIFPRNLVEGYCGEFEARNASSRETRTQTAG